MEVGISRPKDRCCVFFFFFHHSFIRNPYPFFCQNVQIFNLIKMNNKQISQLNCFIIVTQILREIFCASCKDDVFFCYCAYDLRTLGTRIARTLLVQEKQISAVAAAIKKENRR